MMSLAPSSPRLPSPPPPTEVQIPSPGSSSNQESVVEQSIIDLNASRRIHPGTKSADMAAGPPLIALGELDSAFQLQEHLKALHHYYTRPSSDDDHTVPITRETALIIATQPEGLDRALWLYELCRFLINKCNDLIVGFLFDNPPCSASTCPEMRASEWQFLCAVHETPKSCCPIDYCCHTLDWATNIVTSQKIFPSRLSLGAGDAIDDRGAGVKHLINIFRRLHRIFAHAWFQHREVFWRIEGQTGLYVLFKTVCDNYELLPAENYKLPPEAEGLEPAEDVKAPAPSILKGREDAKTAYKSDIEEQFMNVSTVGRTNTRRHIRQSPSVGSAVTTVIEAEEDDPDVTQKLEDIHISDKDSETETETETEIPVIVESYEVSEHEDDVEPESDSHEPAQDDSPPTSTTSSWDRMSSDFLEEKPELVETNGPVQEESLPELNEIKEDEPTKSMEAESNVEEISKPVVTEAEEQREEPAEKSPKTAESGNSEDQKEESATGVVKVLEEKPTETQEV